MLLLMAAPLSAANFAAAFLETGLGTRGLGMGGAFVAAADDASAAYWNPAGLANATGKSLQTSIQVLSLGRRQNSASFALNLRGDLGVGFAWMHAGVEAQGRTPSGQRTGSIEDSENAFYVAMGRALGERLALGFAMEVFDQRLALPFSPAATARGHGFDLGARFRLDEGLVMAATLRHLGGRLNWKVRRTGQQSSHREDSLPRLGVLGLAWRPVAPVWLTGDLEKGEGAVAHLGAEWEVNPLLTVRGGLHRLGARGARGGMITAGLTLQPMRRQTLKFHYAYVADALEAGDRAVFGLALHF
jgi:hypothetical protein